MRIHKAVITAAGRTQRSLPLQTLIDRDGVQKSVLRIIVDEALRAGVEQICVVVCPGDEGVYAEAAGDAAGSLRFVQQPEPLGYGHAVYCARDFVAGEPFLHLVGDHLYVSSSGKGCAQQLVELAQAENVHGLGRAGVAREPAALLRHGRRPPGAGPPGSVRGRGRHREADADRGRTAAAGARPARRPLPLSVRHARPDPRHHGRSWTAKFARPARGVGSTSPARWPSWRSRERCLALEIQGWRYDVGVKYGLLTAQTGACPERQGPRRGAGRAAGAHLVRRRRRVTRSQRYPPAQATQTQDASTDRNAPTRLASSALQVTSGAPSKGPSGRTTHRHHHIARPSRPQPLAGRVLPLGIGLRNCSPSAEPWTQFRRVSDNLYERVRASFFLYAIHRFHLPAQAGHAGARGLVPFDGYHHLLQRRFEEAIDVFLRVQAQQGPSDGISSALAEAYHRLGFQTLADQVRRSVRSVRGNQWMFRIGHPADQPLRVRPELLQRARRRRALPDPARDARRCAWTSRTAAGATSSSSGMDYPEGARVLNVSIDLGVRGRDAAPAPAGRGLSPRHRRAGAAPGQRRPGRHRRHHRAWPRSSTLPRTTWACSRPPSSRPASCRPASKAPGRAWPTCWRAWSGPGRGLELVSTRQRHPQGLAAGRLDQPAGLPDRRLHARHRPGAVADRPAGRARAAPGRGARDPGRVAGRLGRRLAGLGRRLAGHQADRGRAGRAKAIRSSASAAAACCPATTSSALDEVAAGDAAAAAGQPRARPRRHGAERRPDPGDGHREVPAALRGRVAGAAGGDAGSSTRSWPRCAPATCRAIGAVTTRNFFGPIQTIIPWASNLYTETLIEQCAGRVRRRLLGLLDAGRHVGRRHGLHLRPRAQGRRRRTACRRSCATTKRELRARPALCHGAGGLRLRHQRARHVRRAADRRRGADAARLLRHDRARAAAPGPPRSCRRCAAPSWTASAPPAARGPSWPGMVQTLFDRLLPRAATTRSTTGRAWTRLLDENGFDRAQHEQIRADLRSGRIGLAQNRLPVEHRHPGCASPATSYDATGGLPTELPRAGPGRRWREGEVAVVTLAGGVGSRWTQGAGVVKALHPFCKLGGRHRTFIETHLAKSRRIAPPARARRSRTSSPPAT